MRAWPVVALALTVAAASAAGDVGAETVRSWLALDPAGRTLAERGPERPMIAASLVKLDTARRALEHDRADQRLPLRVLRAGGIVWLRGPAALVTDDVLWTLAVTLAEAGGVTEVRVDPGPWRARTAVSNRYPDGTRFNPGVGPIMLAPDWLTPDQGAALAALAPTELGVVVCLPADPGPGPSAIRCPHLVAGLLLTTFLRALGCEVAFGGLGAAPDDALEAARWPGPTVGELVRTMLQQSDNGLAAFLSALSAPDAMDDGGPSGSGLDGERRISARGAIEAVAALLDGHLERLSWLPLGGRSGTLRERFADPRLQWRVRAKTGTLAYVSALTGALLCPGRTLRFAWLAGDDARHRAHRLGDAGARLNEELWRVEQEAAAEEWLAGLLEAACPAAAGGE